MRWMCLSMCLVACSPKSGSGPGSGVDTGGSQDTDDEPPVSTFGSGRYRTSTFAVLDSTDDDGTPQGMDVDGDGEVDNQLPSVLPIVNTFTEADYSVAGLNGSIADAIAAEDLIMFLEAVQSSGVLTTDLLLGATDGSGGYTIDSTSYTGAGVPHARLVGEFSSQTDFTTIADEVQIPVIFDPEQAPVLLPLAMAQMVGTVDEEGSSGLLAGALPVDGLVDQVVAPLLPEGDEYDPASYLNMERDELLAYVRELGNSNLADVELDDGRMGISAALVFVSTLGDWTD